MITFLRTIVVPLTSVSVEEGAKNQLWAGTAKGVENGLYYEPIGVTGKASRQAQSDDLAKKLYDWTEKELESQEL
jgi:retinol dehydrogenase-12